MSSAQRHDLKPDTLVRADYQVASAQITYAGREVQSQADSTGDSALPSAIRPKDHIQVWTWTEFDVVICHKILELYADNGARDEAREK